VIKLAYEGSDLRVPKEIEELTKLMVKARKRAGNNYSWVVTEVLDPVSGMPLQISHSPNSVTVILGSLRFRFDNSRLDEVTLLGHNGPFLYKLRLDRETGEIMRLALVAPTLLRAIRAPLSGFTR